MSHRPHLHFDCSSGLAGDMFLGACLDLGMPLEVVAEAVARLDLPGVAVEARRARRGGLAGTRFRVLRDGLPIEGPDPEELSGEPEHGHSHPHDHAHPHDHPHPHPHPAAPPGHHPLQAPDLVPTQPSLQPEAGPSTSSRAPSHAQDQGRTLAEIRSLLRGSSLAAPVRDRALALFERLGAAEAAVHGVPLDEVHFHEVGAVDSIVDLVGAAAAVEDLGASRITCGPVFVGGGTVATAHGRLPVPPPAAAHLLAAARVPVYGGDGGELLTPTGAVLLAELVDAFGSLPPLVLEGVGTGLGRKQVPGRPNAFRLLAGRPAAGLETGIGTGSGDVVVVEAAVDDLPGEGFGFLSERLFAEGALDVYFTPVQMKKNRPGTLVTLLARPGEAQALAGLLLAESGSLGCRLTPAARFEAERWSEEVATPFGAVRIKRARWGGRRVADAPEYEDCRRLALAAGVPWREVYAAALAASVG